MKIICDSREEYESLMKTCKYLHDFVVEDKNGDFQCLDQEFEQVGFIVHLYLGKEDFPNKFGYISIKGLDVIWESFNGGLK